MGRVKAEMMEYDELGFSKPEDKNICSNHFSDEAIIAYIDENSTESPCSYCRSEYQSSSVISLDELMRLLCRGIYHFYDDAANAGLSFESAEGGYQGIHFDKYELIHYEIGLELDNEKIYNDIIQLMPDYAFCKKDPFTLDQNQEMIYDWKKFADLLKHKVRYSFFRTKEFDNGNIEVSDILREIALSVDELDLIKTLKAGQEIYRSRQHSVKENPRYLHELASAPAEKCSLSNRMSPAGISMFYGAFDEETARKEVLDMKTKIDRPLITTAKFILKEDLQIIDLCNLPSVPSIFDDAKRKSRYKTLFLSEFVREISREIDRDGYEHVDYVPTQVITEYFRYVVPEIAHYNVDGIIYPSAKKGGKNCCVLFFDNKECQKVFHLASDSISSITL